MVKKENGKKAIKLAVITMLFVTILFVLTTAVQAAGKNIAMESKAVNEVPIDFTPIYDVNDLYKINVDPNGKYMLMNDIDLSETNGGSLDAGNGWVPLKGFGGD